MQCQLTHTQSNELSPHACLNAFFVYYHCPTVNKLNADPSVHGILMQLPLPAHIDEALIIGSVDPLKDVDGLHPDNMKQLLHVYNTHTGGISKDAEQTIASSIPCTPLGCIEILDRCGVTIEGKEAVVIGRSNMVGIPAALLLMQRNATVTIAHSKTKNIEEVVRRADIVIAAVGKAEMVKGSWVKPGAVVIDVGINSVEDSTKKRGHRLVGDVDFAEVSQVASMTTPVPGGVGPMTIAMLLKNTLNSAYAALVRQQSQKGRK
jgi:5,10-methylene-tetrahydrofolate dehydrogenase/methenyl tetrahydrofolate cyclohydrolase